MVTCGGIRLAILAGFWCSVLGVQIGAETTLEDEVQDAVALVQAGQVRVHEHNDRQDPWPQILADHTRCVDTSHTSASAADCQAEAIAAGLHIFQYSESSGRCETVSDCSSPSTGTINDWKVYQMELWPQDSADKTRCYGATAQSVSDIYACQLEAIAAGHAFFQYSTSNGIQCETFPTCSSYNTATSNDWAVYKDPSVTGSPTASPTATSSPTLSPTAAPTPEAEGCIEVYNGDFEMGTLGAIPDGWKRYFGGTTGLLVDEEAYSGSRSIYFEGPSWELIENGPDEAYAWSIESGVTYTLKFWAKTANGGSGYQIRTEFLMYNGYVAGAGHEGRHPGGLEYAYYFPTGLWTEFSYTFTPTESWSNIRMNIGLRDTSPNTGKVYIDKLSFPGCTASPTMSPTSSPTTSSPTGTPTMSPTSLSPTMTPTAAVSANLVGDPHVTSVHGDRFDVHLMGNVTLLQIPKSTEAEPLLKLTGLLHKTDPTCREGTYLTALHVDGAWMPQRRVFYPAPRRAGARQKQRVSVGPYGISIVVVHGKTETGVPYLNLRVNNLGGLKLPIGGLLGGDDPAALGKPLDCA